MDHLNLHRSVGSEFVFAKRRVWFALLALMLAGAYSARAAIQFDLFLGYDGVVPEASWFPLVCEIKNDGPSFVGTVEVAPGNLNPGQVRRLVVELPTGTLKRVVVPVFSTTRGYTTWDVRLLDERGKVRAEQINLSPRKQVSFFTPVLGALARTPSGLPTIRPVLVGQPEWQPVAVRFQPPIFPDNPLVLEGMRVLYLNSERALDLGVSQVNAIYAWVHAGGHLVIGVEQVGDMNAKPWLKDLAGCEFSDFKAVRRHPGLNEWLLSGGWAELPEQMETGSVQPRRYGYGPKKGATPVAPAPAPAASKPFSELKPDSNFELAEIQVAGATPREGKASVLVAAADGTPLILENARGRGKVTTLLFSPEREPFRSWEHMPLFWAKMADVPSAWYTSSDFNNAGGWSSDGIFGAMLDTRQVNKLPVTWLLLLLIVYLVVIGPLDQYWLKRIGKPMLTWVTFPCYVVFFSLLIYFIGYKLRAGESEWTELHIVDVVNNEGQTQLRGRTYASVYAPSNQRYPLASEQKYATLRTEFAGSFGGASSGDKGTVLQAGDSFKADVFVGVWTSQLLISDWWQPATSPLRVEVVSGPEGWDVRVENHTGRKLTAAHIAVDEQLFSLGDLAPGATNTFNLNRSSGRKLRDFVQQHAGQFQTAVQSRQYAFGSGSQGRIDDLPNASLAASLISQLPRPQTYGASFIAPPGLDLSPTLKNGAAIFLAWDANYAPVKPIHQFTPRRSAKNTLWRVVVD